MNVSIQKILPELLPAAFECYSGKLLPSDDFMAKIAGNQDDRFARTGAVHFIDPSIAS